MVWMWMRLEGAFSKKQLDSMCKAFIDVENDFREKYRQSIEKKDTVVRASG
jgi:hypothetical protein